MDFDTAIALDVRPLTDTFGVEIRGVDLASCGAETHRAVADVFHRHGILVVRDQHLTPEQQMMFSRAFGTPETNVRTRYTYPGIPEIYVISNKVENGEKIGDVDAGQGWHTDGSYLPEPVSCTMLYAMEVPPEGSDTLMADLVAAWNELSPERQTELEGLQVQHSWKALMELRGLDVDPKDDTIPDVVHPLVRSHPADGRKALWVSTGTTRGIVGMPNPQGLELLEELVTFVTQDRFVFRHKWQVGDVLIWDNRCTLHTGTKFDTTKYTRHVHRTWMKGDRPF
jgi:taurine dioxygenase